jgi:hypothetical protein
MQRAKQILFGLILLGAAALARAEYLFSEGHWAIEAKFPDKPKTDGVLTPSEQGDVKVQRFYWEPSTEHYLLARFEYPMALELGAEIGLYDKSLKDLMKSRPGQVKEQGAFALGSYDGAKLVVAQRREKSIREVRFVLIGSVLYMASAEYPEAMPGAAGRAAQFFSTIQLKHGFENPREVAERDRWRELASGRFKLRYDATRWYRDPADAEPGIFNLLRTDQLAEAQFICENHPTEGGDIVRAVLDTAQEGAESVALKRRAVKLRGTIEVIELEFSARVERVTYTNHGYFFSGPEGTVQLRGWSNERDYRDVEGDITELLDGLGVVGK